MKASIVPKSKLGFCELSQITSLSIYVHVTIEVCCFTPRDCILAVVTVPVFTEYELTTAVRMELLALHPKC